MKNLILDMGSSVNETYVRQERSTYNGHFTCECQQPQFIFDFNGDVERALLLYGTPPAPTTGRRGWSR